MLLSLTHFISRGPVEGKEIVVERLEVATKVGVSASEVFDRVPDHSGVRFAATFEFVLLIVSCFVPRVFFPHDLALGLLTLVFESVLSVEATLLHGSDSNQSRFGLTTLSGVPQLLLDFLSMLRVGVLVQL